MVYFMRQSGKKLGFKVSIGAKVSCLYSLQWHLGDGNTLLCELFTPTWT